LLTEKHMKEWLGEGQGDKHQLLSSTKSDGRLAWCPFQNWKVIKDDDDDGKHAID